MACALYFLLYPGENLHKTESCFFFGWWITYGKVENVLSNCCWLLFSWLSAIFVYTVLDLFIVEKAESVTGIKWSLCWSDSDTNWTAACILQSVIAPIAFFNVFVNINSNRCLKINTQESKTKQKDATVNSWLWFFSKRFPVWAPTPSWAGPVQQQPAFYPVWGSWRPVLPIKAKTGKKPLGVRL